MRLGGDGVRSSRKGIVRAQGLCAGWSVAEPGAAWAQGVARRGQSGANGAGCAEACCRRVPGRGGGAGLGLGGLVSHGSQRLELVVGRGAAASATGLGAGLVACNQGVRVAGAALNE